MPNDNRKIRSVNVDPAVWEAAKEKAAGEDTTMSKVIRNALEVYVNGAPK